MKIDVLKAFSTSISMECLDKRLLELLYSLSCKQIVAVVGSDSYTFDNFGNITTDASRAYSFNWENRLASVTKSSVTTVYDYDEEGIRVKKTTPSKVTQYIDKYTEIDDTDVIRHIFAGTKRIASIDGAAAVTYNHEDHLGSSNIRTDASGSVIKSIEYLPFGDKRTQSGSYNTIKNRFTGLYEDEESDLYYYQQRYYDPSLSRFITADPLYLEEMEKRGTDTQELNVYAYVRNYPLKFVDPTGENLSDYLIALVGGLSKGDSLITAHSRASVFAQNADAARLSPNEQGVMLGARAAVNELTPIGAIHRIAGGIDPYTGNSISDVEKLSTAVSELVPLLGELKAPEKVIDALDEIGKMDSVSGAHDGISSSVSEPQTDAPANDTGAESYREGAI